MNLPQFMPKLFLILCAIISTSCVNHRGYSSAGPQEIDFSKQYTPSSEKQVDASFNIKTSYYKRGIKVFKISEKRSSYGIECNYYNDLGTLETLKSTPKDNVIKTKIPANSKVGVLLYVDGGPPQQRFKHDTYKTKTYCEIAVSFDTDSESNYEIDTIHSHSARGCSINVTKVNPTTGSKITENSTKKYFSGCLKVNSKAEL